MTHREQFIRTLKCEKIRGRVHHFELIFLFISLKNMIIVLFSYSIH